jgi:hypothetical protein
MTQISANTLTYDQIYLKLKSFYDKEVSGAFISNQERLEEYKKLLSDIQDSVGRQSTKFEPIVRGEPPSSAKFNAFSSSLVDDTNLIAKHIDYLNAKVVNAFNLFNEEIETEKKYLERISSKAKVLQMYSGAPSDDLIYLGDSFENADQVDVGRIASGLNPHIEGGAISLPIVSVKPWAIRQLSIDVNKSNGFLGNDHQALKGVDPEDLNAYKYLYKTNPAISSISSLGDSNPLTYFEYEGLHVDRDSNRLVDKSLVSDDEFCYRAVKGINSNKNDGELLNWSNFDTSNPLKLTIILKASSPDFANNIIITPYFTSCNLVKITSIRAVSNSDVVTELLNGSIYIGTSMIPTSSYMVDHYYYNRAQIKFPEIRALRFEIDMEQSEYKDIDILHSYWKTNYQKSTTNKSPFYSMERFNPKNLDPDIYESVEYDISKLIPDTSMPNKIKDITQAATNLPVKVKRKEIVLRGKVVTLSVTELRKISDSWVAYPPKTYYYLSYDDKQPFESMGTEDSLTYTDDYTEVFKQDNGKYFSDTDALINEVNLVSDFLSIVAEADYFPTISSFDEEELTAEELAVRITDLQTTTAVFELDESTTHLINLYPLTEDKSYTLPAQTKNYSVPLKLSKEVYQAKRKTIGIRDIEISYEKYASRAEMVSAPFNFYTQIESLMLDVDSSISNNLSNDLDVRFYVSLNDINWIEISPIQLSSNGTAEVLVFNKNLPINYQLPGVAYLNYPEVPQDIKSVRVKIEMYKSKNANLTPVIYSYKLIAKVKNQ